MTSHRDPDDLLAAYLAEGMTVLPDRVVDAVLDEVHRTRQRTVFGPWRTRSVFKAALGVAAAFTVLAVGGSFFLGQRGQPAVVGGPSQTPATSGGPTLGASASPSEPATRTPSATAQAQAKAAVFVFNKGTGSSADCGNDGRGGCISRLWVANVDGTAAHELLPDQGGCQRVQAWSPDGTRLLFSHSDCHVDNAWGGMTGVERFYLTDASGSEPQLVDTGCVDRCVAEDDAVFSGDGRQVLFVRTESVPAPPSATPDPMGKPVPPTEKRVLASIDLATGRVTELGGFDTCDQCGTEWPRSYPVWSPDRTQIVFTSGAPFPPSPAPESPAVFVADADGRNARQVSPLGQFPGWSPDGARLVFQGIKYTWTGKWVPGKVVSSSSDIYTVRPDGTDFQQLTTDGRSYLPRWALDGRIWYARPAAGETMENWVMDADGGNAARSSQPPQPQELADAAVQPTP